MTYKPNIAICGISIESSTYTPYINQLEDFVIFKGNNLFVWYPFLQTKATLLKALNGKDLTNSSNLPNLSGEANWFGFTRARSIPGGAVDKAFYESIKLQIINDIKQYFIRSDQPLDGILLDIHGAMSVVGMTDAEGDLARAIRQQVDELSDNPVLISTTMDLHGNVTKQLLQSVDLLTCYRTAPHIDSQETKIRACYNLLNLIKDIRQGGKLPLKGYLSVPILLPGEKTSTRVEPAKAFYKRVTKIANMTGIIDCSLFMGYPWADQPRCQAYIIIIGYNKKLISQQAESLAQDYWQARDKFNFVGPAAELDKSIYTAIEQINNQHKPFFISDSGDNPTAGGTGDNTKVLHTLLNNSQFVNLLSQYKILYTQIWDELAAEKLAKYKVGQLVKIKFGAKYDKTAPPVELEGQLYSLLIPKTEELNTANYSDSAIPGGIEAVIKIDKLYIIISQKRKPYHNINDFAKLGLDIDKFDIVFVKIGYLEPQLYKAANNGQNWIMALTPGGVDQRITKLPRTKALPILYPITKITSQFDRQVKQALICQFIN
ncbi:MAG: M81 family metallopeptidase [Bifidobacteriaceae bacterium]|jgi:microcystin degradation protein MlrC|nr:M81 family metallopeptidase [Bifidobacteriaceae bacterium]